MTDPDLMSDVTEALDTQSRRIAELQRELAEARARLSACEKTLSALGIWRLEWERAVRPNEWRDRFDAIYSRVVERHAHIPTLGREGCFCATCGELLLPYDEATIKAREG